MWQQSDPETLQMTNEDEPFSTAHPSFRLMLTSSRTNSLQNWLTEELVNLAFSLPTEPMNAAEEADVLVQTGCDRRLVEKLVDFADRYRVMISSETTSKSRPLGTRALMRIAKRLASLPWIDDLRPTLEQAVLAEFLPATERMALEDLFEDCQMPLRLEPYNPPPVIENNRLVFPPSSSSDGNGPAQAIQIPLHDNSNDREGAAALIPNIDHFYDNSLQTGVMRDLITDLEVLKDHVVVMGNQGTGKNVMSDRLMQVCRFVSSKENWCLKYGKVVAKTKRIYSIGVYIFLQDDSNLIAESRLKAPRLYRFSVDVSYLFGEFHTYLHRLATITSRNSRSNLDRRRGR